MSEVLLKNVSKTYRGSSKPAVDAVSLQVEAGEIVALIGESGCGKTTLLRLLAGLERPDTGEIHIGGQLVSGAGRFVAPENRKTGMVFQDYALFPHLNVRKNILYGLRDKGQAESRLQELLALTGLEGLDARFPHELSGGQQQRVALARALAPSPSLMLLDEPFSNLDELLKSGVRREVKKILKKARMSSLLVTHDIHDAMSVADRAVVLKDGRLQQAGTPKNLYEQPANRYVAEFFGKVNALPPDLATALGAEVATGMQCLCRPEALLCGDAGEGVPAQVEEASYRGERDELSLLCQGHRLTAYAAPGRWQAGDALGLALRQKAFFQVPV
jgi:iron(III) transport system ATP-binding protein